MARPRKSHADLPKYVVVHHGSYWYRHPDGENVKIGPEGEMHLVWRFMLDKTDPENPGQGKSLHEYFDRYKREVVPTLGVRTQKDYARHLAVLDKAFGHMKPDDLKPKHVGQFLDRPKGKIQ